MIICKQCGNENPLGRVFCGGCGSKLDLDTMSRENVAGSQRARWFIRHIVWIIAAVALIPIVMIVLSFVAKTDSIGAEGTRLGANRVVTSFQTLADVENGRSLGVTLKEADVNGYLKYNKAKELKLDRVQVVIRPDWIRFRVVDTLFSLNLGSFKLAPQVSYDLDCVPSGGRLFVKKVKKGHLSLIGPFKNKPVRRFFASLRSKKDWAVLSNLSDIDAQEGQVHLVVDK